MSCLEQGRDARNRRWESLKFEDWKENSREGGGLKTRERNTTSPCRLPRSCNLSLKAKRARDIDKNPGDGRRHLDRIKGCDERIVAVLQVQGRKHAAKY